MSIYTLVDPINPASNGSTGVKVAAGIAYLGENIDLTAPEQAALAQSFTLQVGVTTPTPTSPYRRGDTSVARASRTLN